MARGGATSRGRGGKFKKYTRGGGHHFSRNLQPLDQDGNAVSMWSADAKGEGSDDDSEEDSEEDSDEEDSDEDSEEDSDEEPKKGATAETSREDRKAEKKARKDAAIARAKGKNVQVGDLPSSDEDEDEEDEDSDEDEDMPANPNHSKAARKQAAKPPPGSDDEEEGNKVEGITKGVKNMKAAAPMSRREREAADAAAAKERYMKLHAAGKTDEAKADLARLKVIREQRAAEAERRKAEAEEKEEKDKERKAQIEAREAKLRAAAAGPKKTKKK